MEYPHRYQDTMLVVEIRENDERLAEIDVDGFVGDIIKLNVHAHSAVVFDLNNKKHFNSSDLGALIKAKDMLLDEGIELILQRPSENIVELIKIAGLNDFFKIIV
jgi:anti-anti-sigma factor